MPTSERKYGLVIHGGAGTILREKLTADLEAQIRQDLTRSLNAGYAVLEDGGAALDAVQAAVNVMEDSPHFNAGKGAVFTHDGANEQDATIADGAAGQAGSVAGVRRIARPIDLARLVMEKSPHVVLGGAGAEHFASEHGMELVDGDYFYTERRHRQLQEVIEREKSRGRTGRQGMRLSEDDKCGTVGAVALDGEGRLAAATSSGGMTNKRWGRIGDSSLLGAGTWADRNVAVSTTGHGEYFIRGVTAFDLGALMDYRAFTVDAAARTVIDKLTASGGTGGLIAIDRRGYIAMPFNTTGMYRGHRLPGGKPEIAIFSD